jgi:serine protease Do
MKRHNHSSRLTDANPLRLRRFFTAAFALFVATAVVPAVGQTPQPQVPASRQEMTLSFAPLVRKTAPAVVNIYTKKVVQQRQFGPLFDDPFFRRFFGEGFGKLPNGPAQQRVQNSLGSGVIVDAKGTIVTNHHVIEGADEITVVLSDKREFSAKLFGDDEHTDLAILKIDTGGHPLPYLEFRDSDDLAVGDLVLAIGNPFGVGQTVTSGIVSALARTGIGITDYNSFIQTDAAINPGNSGGALVSMDGRLAGINSAIFSKSGGSHGIGFAIPSNMVRSVLVGLEKNGRLVRPWLGAKGAPVTSDVAASLQLERPSGVLIEQVLPGSPADRAGLRVGDVVMGIGGRVVDDPQALRFRIATLPVGEKASFAVWRRGKTEAIVVDLVAPPENPPRQATKIDGVNPLSGATVANLSPALAEELNLDSTDSGVIILTIQDGSTADRLRFRAGDRIAAIESKHIRSVDELRQTLGGRPERWRMTVVREGREINLDFKR